MSRDLQFLRLSYQLPAKDMAETVQQKYPRFDRFLLSKCESPEVYGVQIRPDALKTLYLKYAPDEWAKRKRRTDGHRNQFRIYCRMDAETYSELFWRIQEDGYKTMQDWMLDQVLAYIERSE